MHPAGATEQRSFDHAARRRMVAPTRRSPPASGKRAYSIGARGREVADSDEGCSLNGLRESKLGQLSYMLATVR